MSDRGPVELSRLRSVPQPVSQARSRTFATDFACHCPPRAVATPRAFSAAAISLRDVAPAFCASRMMGRTLAANRSASAVTASSALLRATMELWVAKGHPASLCSREGLPGPCGDQRALLLGQCGEQVQHERVNVGPKLSDQERHPVGHEAAR